MSESTLVKKPHFFKSHVEAQIQRKIISVSKVVSKLEVSRPHHTKSRQRDTFFLDSDALFSTNGVIVNVDDFES